MKRFDQINVIPFVDIMLVLLTIVLMTASFIVQGKIPLALPTASTAEWAEAQPPHRISVDAKGDVFVDDAPTDIATLDTLVTPWASKTPIRISIDKAASFDHFTHVLDVLRRHQLMTLDIETRKES
jgi:biopolymer transport protein ExbD